MEDRNYNCDCRSSLFKTKRYLNKLDSKPIKTLQQKQHQLKLHNKNSTSHCFTSQFEKRTANFVYFIDVPVHCIFNSCCFSFALYCLWCKSTISIACSTSYLFVASGRTCFYSIIILTCLSYYKLICSKNEHSLSRF